MNNVLEVGKGTGQGLFLVYTRVVKKYGGRISFETGWAKGAIFFVGVPLSPDPST